MQKARQYSVSISPPAVFAAIRNRKPNVRLSFVPKISIVNIPNYIFGFVTILQALGWTSISLSYRKLYPRRLKATPYSVFDRANIRPCRTVKRYLSCGKNVLGKS